MYLFAPIVSSWVSAISRTHANFANVSGARRGAPRKSWKKTEVPLPIYIISAKRNPTQLPHQSCGTWEIFAAVDSAELKMLTATLVFGFGDKSSQTVSGDAGIFGISALHPFRLFDQKNGAVGRFPKKKHFEEI